MKRKNSATIIGLIVSVASFLATYTFIIPFITIIPLGATLENIFSSIFPNDEYSKIGYSVIITLAVLGVLLTIFFFRFFIRKLKRHELISSGSFILFAGLLQFIIHPLGFYIHAAGDWSRAGDGQFMFGIVDTFPVSSLFFVLFGLGLDVLRNSYKQKPADSITGNF